MYKWDDIQKRYTNYLGGTDPLEKPGLTDILSGAEPDIVMSMKRHIGYSSDPTYNPESGLPFDAVFEAIIVVRDNPLLLSICQDAGEQDLYLEKLYQAATERVMLWWKMCVLTWEGAAPDMVDWSDPMLNPHTSLPPKVGAPTITVFGSVMDKAGRYHNITITDQTDPHMLMTRIPYATQLWDNVTHLSSGVDYDTFGKSPFRSSAPGVGKSPFAQKTRELMKKKDDKRLKKKSKIPVGDNDDDRFSSNDGDNTEHAPTAVITPAGTMYCPTTSAVKDLPARSSFEMDVASISLAENKTGRRTLRFHSFYNDAEGKRQPDTNDVVWIPDDYPEFPVLLKAIKEHFPSFEIDKSVTVDGYAVTIKAKKSVSAKMVAYYRDITFGRWQKV